MQKKSNLCIFSVSEEGNDRTQRKKHIQIYIKKIPWTKERLLLTPQKGILCPKKKWIINAKHGQIAEFPYQRISILNFYIKQVKNKNSFKLL